FAKCCSREIAGRFTSAGEAIAELASALGVADSPSKLGRIAVNVRIPTSDRVTDERDALAETRASDVPSSSMSASSALTAPRPALLGGTQFGAEAPKPGRVPRTLGYVVA